MEKSLSIFEKSKEIYFKGDGVDPLTTHPNEYMCVPVRLRK